MNSRTLAKTKNQNSTTFSPVFGKKLASRSFMPQSSDEVRDLSSLNFAHNFGDVQVESPSFKQSCPLDLSGPAHCHFGSACHTCPPRMQAKLKIGQPGDKYEQEADRVAEQVMRMPEPAVHRQVAGLEKQDEEIQTKTLSALITPVVQRQTGSEDDWLVDEIVDPWAPPLGADQWDIPNLDDVYIGGGTRSVRTARPIGMKTLSVEEFRSQIGNQPTSPQDRQPPAIKSASEWATEKGKKTTRLENVTLTRDELYTIVGQNLASKAKGHESQLEAYLGHVATAFRMMRLDTIEAQAAYLAHAAGEAIFATLTEGQKKPFIDDPKQVEISRDPAGPLRYRNRSTIDPLRKIHATANPTYEDTFIGRGPIQVTHDYNYVRTLIYMEEIAKKASAADAQLLWEAIATIKKDPRQAANPKIQLHVFSCLYASIRRCACIG